MRYYDTVLTPQTGKTYLDDGENRIEQSDASVICWFEPLPEGYKRAYTETGLPFNELIPVKTPVEEVEELRQNCTGKCKNDFEESKVTGRVTTSLGFDADNRITGSKTDVMIIEKAIKLGRVSYFVDADDVVHTDMDATKFDTLLLEMETDLADKQVAYHTKKAWISNPETTEEELKVYYEGT